MTFEEAVKAMQDAFTALQLHLKNAEAYIVDQNVAYKKLQDQTAADLSTATKKINAFAERDREQTAKIAELTEKLLATQKVLDEAMKTESALHNVVTGGDG